MKTNSFFHADNLHPCEGEDDSAFYINPLPPRPNFADLEQRFHAVQMELAGRIVVPE